MIQILFALFLLFPTLANATTYYVAKTGSNSNSCVQASTVDGSGNPTLPKLTIASALGCEAAGDTISIRTGTYNEDITGSITSGTSDSVRTTITNFNGEVVSIRSIDLQSGAYITFHGIRVTGTTPNNHLVFLGTSNNITFEDGESSGGKWQGYLGAGNGNKLLRNKIYNNGIGCVTQPLNQCHGIYIGGTTSGMVISGNEVYGNGAHGMQLYPSATNVLVEKNTFYDNNQNNVGGSNVYLSRGPHTFRRNVIRRGSSFVSGTYGLTLDLQSCTGTLVENNTIYNSGTNGITIGACSNVILRNNIVLGHGTNISGANGTTTQTTNRTSGTATDIFVDPTNHDLTLKAGSAAIGTGTNASGNACNDTCDQGAFETFGFSSASIDAASMDVSFLMNLNVPVTNITAANFTVGCTGSNCGTPVVSSASLKAATDSVVRLTITGIGGTGNCAVGQTWTVTYTPGTLTDSAGLGITLPLYQKATAFTTQGVTEVCTGSGGTPPAGDDISYEMDEGTGTNLEDGSGGDDDGTLTNGPEFNTGHSGDYGVKMLGDDDYIAIPYGNAIDPSTQSLTIAFSVLPYPGTESSTRTFFGPQFGASTMLLLSRLSGNWQLGIQNNGLGDTTEFSVSAGWTRVCLNLDSGTDTATLYINGTAGTTAGASTKTYTSFSFTSNFRLGAVQDNLVAYSPVNDTFDEFILYTSVASCADDYAAWEEPAPSPTGTFEQKTHQWRKLRKTAGGAIESYGSAAATMPVMVGGAVILDLQIDCTVANCDPLGIRLLGNVNSNTFIAVPDAFASYNHSFYGVSGDPDILTGTVSCCLTGALTQNDGSTQQTSSAVPVFDLAQNGSIVLRYVIKIGPSATAGDTHCFKAYSQEGTALDTYTPSAGACLTIVSPSTGIGF
jgi:parallel beta-helix repeat protein